MLRFSVSWLWPLFPPAPTHAGLFPVGPQLTVRLWLHLSFVFSPPHPFPFSFCLGSHCVVLASWPGIPFVGQAGLELLDIHLPLPLECGIKWLFHLYWPTHFSWPSVIIFEGLAKWQEPRCHSFAPGLPSACPTGLEELSEPMLIRSSVLCFSISPARA